MAAAGIATRRATTERGYERAAERIEAGQANEMLEEAPRLAASQEVRKAI